MSEIPVEASQALYQQIRTVLVQARARAWQSVNAEMVKCYWEIGRLIVEEEQRGKARAEYGRQIILDLAKRLAIDFGKGFDKSNSWNMRSFFAAYPKIDAVRRELSWTHYRTLLRVEKPESADLRVTLQALLADRGGIGRRTAAGAGVDRAGGGVEWIGLY
ncbi:MAG: DUF1016 N-terminal domain-containing protein [Candidatus Methylomirabilia bacterium]